MLYEYDLDVPANTAERSPASATLKLSRGVITKVGVQFPIGTRALVHVKIYHGAHQLWPANPDGNIKADGFTVEWDEHLEFTKAPLALKVKAWSEADTYEYTVTTRIAMLPLSVTEEYTGVVGALKKLLKAMGVG